ncbi:MAG: S41 family peptidase [Phycisphaerales bacterium JB039]
MKQHLIGAIVLAVSGLLGLSPAAVAQEVPAVETAAPFDAEAWATRLWRPVGAIDEQAFLAALDELPDQAPDGTRLERLAESADLLRAGIDKREQQRTEALQEAEDELEELLAREEPDVKTFAEAIGAALSIQQLSRDPQAFMQSERVSDLVARADAAARDAERRGEWFNAAELFNLLNGLYYDEGTYRKDQQRQLDRLSLIYTYAPQRHWELRNERHMAEGNEPLPPFNEAGVDYRTQIEDINDRMVREAIYLSAHRHVDGVPLADMLLGGIDRVRTMILTADLAATFPMLADRAQVERMLQTLAREEDRVQRDRGNLGDNETRAVLEQLLRQNSETIGLAQEAILREFGNGAMAALDEFSGMVWPHDVRQFNRSTRGNFSGIGVSIQQDDQQNIVVVTPLDGTPAQRAGVRAGDIITKVNGEPTLGFTLDQAVDIITGPIGTNVQITVKRETAGDEQELDFDIKRDLIELKTVKGWRRLDADEDHWDWFIDPEQRIGYVRLTGFSEKTARDFDFAIATMKNDGLAGLIVDLRFNRGGLLDQAVEITSRFISRETARRLLPRGVVVSTVDGDNNETQPPEQILPTKDYISRIPVVILINEGSASASEIVAGAVQDYAHAGGPSAIVLGHRSYGKGSVQNVVPLDRTRRDTMAYLKLTTQYYVLPDGRKIHRRPGSTSHGVAPDVEIEMLPSQIAESITLRQNADVVPLDEHGEVLPEERPDPDTLITDGADLQLHAALLLLQAHATADAGAYAMLPTVEEPVRIP